MKKCLAAVLAVLLILILLGASASARQQINNVAPSIVRSRSAKMVDQLRIATKLFEGIGKDAELSGQSMLLAAFIAGNVRSQIKNDRAEDDTYSGWLFAIDAYNRLRAKNPFRSPSIDSLSKMESGGTLLQHAKDVQSKEEQEAPADAQKKPFA